MLREFSLEGKRALVTGGSSGIGRAIALVLAEAGADVAVAARTVKNVEAAANEIRGLGRRSVAIQCDVSDSDQVNAMVATATEGLGGVDILVNSAGMGGDSGPIASLPEPPPTELLAHYNNPSDYATPLTDDAWHTVMDTNLASVFYVCRAVGPQIMERRRGKIINVSSASGILAYPFGAPYQTSKAGLNMLTKVLAMEWGTYNINVNGILLGWFVTPMTQEEFDIPEIRRKRTEGLPIKRLTDTRDLGLLAVYLASPASDWMTGQCIALDGGESVVLN